MRLIRSNNLVRETEKNIMILTEKEEIDQERVVSVVIAPRRSGAKVDERKVDYLGSEARIFRYALEDLPDKELDIWCASSHRQECWRWDSLKTRIENHVKRFYLSNK